MMLDFHTNKKVLEEVAIIPYKYLHNKNHQSLPVLFASSLSFSPKHISSTEISSSQPLEEAKETGKAEFQKAHIRTRKYEEKLPNMNQYHDPTINPGLGLPCCLRCLSLFNNVEDKEKQVLDLECHPNLCIAYLKKEDGTLQQIGCIDYC